MASLQVGNVAPNRLETNRFLTLFAGVYLESSIEKLKSEGTERMIPLKVDVSNEDSVEGVARQIKQILQEKKGQLVGLVNNAGILVQPGPVEWTPSDAYRRMFNVNVMGTVMTTKSCKSKAATCEPYTDRPF